VEYFFVLSGFVLMSGFADRLGDPRALRRFCMRRLARLYPLHLAAIAALAVLVGIDALGTDVNPFTGTLGPVALLHCLALVQGFTGYQLSWNFPSWSISIELWTSLLFGVTQWRFAARSWIAFGVYAVLLLALIAGFSLAGSGGTGEIKILLNVAHYVADFFVGALLLRLFHRLRVMGWSPPGWAEFVAAAVVVATFLLADRAPAALTVVPFALAIFVFAFEAGLISRVLRSRPLQAVGTWSYSIYLVHPLWTIAIYKLILAGGRRSGQVAMVQDASGERLILGGPFLMDLAAAGCVALVLATAWLTYRLIEQPGRRLAGETRRPAMRLQGSVPGLTPVD